jgi:hypothetical protein
LTLGYSSLITLLLTALPYVLAAIVFYVISYISDRRNVMYIIIVICLGVAVVAYIIALSTLNTGARYFAMMLTPSVCSGPQILLYKTLHLHMARPFPKRVAGVAMINAIGGLSNVWGSYLYYDGPHFYAAFRYAAGLYLCLFCHDYALLGACAPSEPSPRRLARGSAQGHEERRHAAAGRYGLAVCGILGSVL